MRGFQQFALWQISRAVHLDIQAFHLTDVIDFTWSKWGFTNKILSTLWFHCCCTADRMFSILILCHSHTLFGFVSDCAIWDMNLTCKAKIFFGDFLKYHLFKEVNSLQWELSFNQGQIKRSQLSWEQKNNRSDLLNIQYSLFAEDNLVTGFVCSVNSTKWPSMLCHSLSFHYKRTLDMANSNIVWLSSVSLIIPELCLFWQFRMFTVKKIYHGQVFSLVCTVTSFLFLSEYWMKTKL